VFYSAFTRGLPDHLERPNSTFTTTLSPITVSPVKPTSATSENDLEIGAGTGDRGDSPAAARKTDSTGFYSPVNVRTQEDAGRVVVPTVMVSSTVPNLRLESRQVAAGGDTTSPDQDAFAPSSPTPLFYSVVGDRQAEHGMPAPGRDTLSAPIPLLSPHSVASDRAACAVDAPVQTPAPPALEAVVRENEKLRREIALLRNEVTALTRVVGSPTPARPDSVAVAVAEGEEENRPLLAAARAPSGRASGRAITTLV